ncbi:alpha-beta hydrolase superfamily lysophospholipase [Georgenia soli]|uniref:Alpha-beta hydrolase superfamily lysophospholipase n=1 Tax=Georgenia soli TaxID=638953 RepID=A0A2A9ENX0_9MICO|nr:alpha/beta hydrolase [Georgenia soli]PFG40286.1 alpha-beta hydrolase superfamily lysophospholipase [Georgenia soli]
MARRNSKVEETSPDRTDGGAVLPEEIVELPAPPPADRWTPDVLGAGFQARTLPLHDDDEGEVAATLVRHVPADDPDALPGTPSSPTFAVLYLHGWNDYFYQRELARRWSADGGAFYALDLRKYGRSLRAHQTRGFMESLTVYDEDIHAALKVVRAELGVGTDLVLMGHSTGGLTAALWAHRHPGALRALVLNSPWLELQGSAILRGVAQPIVGSLAKLQPRAVLPTSDLGFYQRTLTGWTDDDGPLPDGGTDDPFYAGWAPDPRWRVVGAPIRAGWLAAVLAGHQQVAAGLEISCPVLVLTSGRTLIAPRWSPQMRETDTVLDVEQIRRRALQLGPLVTVARFEGAIHDVTLSARDVRGRVYAELRRWSRAYVHR